jgi:uncharacterized protein YbjT (DUF2867 family)
MNKILVVGASGTVGTSLVEALRAKGHEVVRATSQKPGADQRLFNLVTGEGLSTAFTDIERAFLLSPPGHTNQDELLGPVIAEAKAKGLKKVVLMTAMGANADDSLPMRKAEIALEKSGHNILTHGEIQLPVADAKGSFIDTRDIAAVAAELLTRHDFDNRDFDLTGDESLDHHQVAELLSRVTEKPIRFRDITPEELRSQLLAAQLPGPYVEMLLTILGYFKLGYSARITDAVSTITGRAPIRFAQYAKDYRSAWVR